MLDPVDAAPAAPDPEPGRADPTAGETVLVAPGPLHRRHLFVRRGSAAHPRDDRPPRRSDARPLVPRDRRDPDRVGRAADRRAAQDLRAARRARDGRRDRRCGCSAARRASRGSPGSKTSKASDGATSSRSSSNCSRSRARRSCCCPASVYQTGRQAHRGASRSPSSPCSRCPTLAVLYAATHAGGHVHRRRGESRSSVRARRDFEARRGAIERRLRDEVVGITSEDLLAARLGLRGALDVDVVRRARRRRRGSITRSFDDLDEAAVHREDAAASRRRGSARSGHVASAPRNGACPVRNAMSPSSRVRTMTMSASPSNRTCSGETSSTCNATVLSSPAGSWPWRAPTRRRRR